MDIASVISFFWLRHWIPISNKQNSVQCSAKNLEFHQKFSAARRISTLFSVFGYSNETLPLVFDTLLLILRIHIVHYIKDDFMPAMMQFSSFEQQSTYYDENDKINPVPKAMRVLNIIHDICPALECDHLYTQGNIEKLQDVSCINRYIIQTDVTNTTKQRML